MEPVNTPFGPVVRIMSWYTRFVPHPAGFVMHRSRLVAAALLIAAPLSAQTLDSSVIAAFRWRNVGPSNFMGRLSDVQGIPSPSKTIYIAAAAGGVWKSPNNGLTWRPLLDDKEVSAHDCLFNKKMGTHEAAYSVGARCQQPGMKEGQSVPLALRGGRR